MTSRPPVLRILVGLLAAIALSLVAPAPAHAATVTLNTSRTSAPPSIAVTFSGTAAGAVTGAPVTLQRRPASGGSFSTVKTGGKVTSSDTYALAAYVAVGTYSYRTRVGSSSFSPPKTVTGIYGRNVAVPAAGAPFTLTARLPQAQSRLVKAQVSTNGTTWTTRGQGTSNSAGKVGIRTYLMATSYVRVVAPATGSAPTWVGPRGRVTIGTDPVIKKILDDTNAHRATHGLPALKLKASLNKVAGNWAYHMHQTSNSSDCPASFKHNPNFSAQYSSGWKAAGENIAAGHSYQNVVNAWIASTSGHHENIDGKRQPGASGPHPNFTHIGIGYFFGTKCYGRYYVQNFATY